MKSEESHKHILKINLYPNDALRYAIPETDLSQDLEWEKISVLMHNTMESADSMPSHIQRHSGSIIAEPARAASTSPSV